MDLLEESGRAGVGMGSARDRSASSPHSTIESHLCVCCCSRFFPVGLRKTAGSFIELFREPVDTPNLKHSSASQIERAKL